MVLKSETNIQYLKKIKFQSGMNADENGNLGPVYGTMALLGNGRWKTVDQIVNVIQQIKTNPDSRRHLVIAFNL